MPRAIGLDIGTHAVRAAAVRSGRPSEVQAFGQVGLPRGAVERGEIVDPGIVAIALRRLWREAHLGDRRVRVGLASLRTIVRQIEMPTMDEAELRSALEFRAGEFIPLPPEETYLDFKVVEPFTSPDGEEMIRVLIAAIHRDTVQNALTAVREAGLQAVSFDLTPFALARALAPPSLAARSLAGTSPEADAEADVDAEVIVSIGAGVTIVVVHEAGVINFVRIVDAGGEDFTTAIEQSLDLPFEEAEVLKRLLGGPAERRDDALAAVEAPMSSLLNEIRGSVDFYLAQAGARPIQRVVLTGGGALFEGLAQRLSDSLGVPADLADVALNVGMGDIGFLPEQIAGLQPHLPAPVGLALSADKTALYRINLLSERERRVFSLGRAAVAGVAAGVIVVGGLAVLTMQRNDDLAAARDRLEEQQSTNQQIQGTISGLQGANDLQAQADAAEALLATAVTGEVAWSRVLQELARVIPGDVWLDSAQMSSTQVGATDAAAAAGTAPTGLGTLTFTAAGLDYPSAAAWLQRLSTLPSISAPWVSQVAEASASIGGQEFDTVAFTSNATLTDAALSERARRAALAAGAAIPGTPAPTDTTATTAPAAG